MFSFCSTYDLWRSFGSNLIPEEKFSPTTMRKETKLTTMLNWFWSGPVWSPGLLPVHCGLTLTTFIPWIHLTLSCGLCGHSEDCGLHVPYSGPICIYQVFKDSWNKIIQLWFWTRKSNSWMTIVSQIMWIPACCLPAEFNLNWMHWLKCFVLWDHGWACL